MDNTAKNPKPAAPTPTNKVVRPLQLLDLPPELRLMIYELLITVEYPSSDGRHCSPRTNRIRIQIDRDILGTYSAINAEAAPVVKRLFEQAQLMRVRQVAEEHGWGLLEGDVIHFECWWHDLVTFTTIEVHILAMLAQGLIRYRRR